MSDLLKNLYFSLHILHLHWICKRRLLINLNRYKSVSSFLIKSEVNNCVWSSADLAVYFVQLIKRISHARLVRICLSYVRAGTNLLMVIWHSDSSRSNCSVTIPHTLSRCRLLDLIKVSSMLRLLLDTRTRTAGTSCTSRATWIPRNQLFVLDIFSRRRQASLLFLLCWILPLRVERKP